MSYLNYDGLAYFKSKLTNWVDQNYLSKTNTGNTTVAGNVTFTQPVTGDLDGKAKKDWLGQKIDETYIKEIATNNNAGTIVYTKGNGSTNHILIDILQGATPAANGKAGLVPAPTVSEMYYFLRGDGNWAVPTDVYVNQNLITSSNNDQFPILLSGTSGTPATKTNATVGYTNVVSVNPLTNALMASQFISKHPTYNRQSTVTSKVQYSLNFTDVVSGAGHNLGEVVGYVDTLANGGEHELGLRLFGNPNVQGTEEDYVYMSVGLSKTNVAYGHAPSTPLPSDHNEPTDIITRDWLARNGSETGLVHTSMNETIGGIKTFTDETRNTSTAGITTTKLTASGKITGTGTAEISGGSGNTPSLKVTGNETVTGDLSVGGSETVGGTLTTTGNISTANGNISTTNGNISTTNGTVSGKTGSIGSGGLTVTGPSNLNGKITAGNGLDVTGNTETDTLTVNGNETVGGTLTVTGKITGNGGVDTTTLHATDDVIADDDVTVGDTLTVNNQIIKKTGNTTQEYVSYITNQQETRNTIITNVVKPNGGLSVVSSGADKGKIYVDTGDGLAIDNNGKINVDFRNPDPEFIQGIVESMVAPGGGLYYVDVEFLQEGDTYVNSQGQVKTVTAAQAAQTASGFPNPNYGKLLVDFEQMPQSVKDGILKSLDMLVPLRNNLVLYVSTTGSDTIVEGRGTDDLPFATIGGAAQYVASTYNLGSNNVYIIVNPGNYGTATTMLPAYTTSTGTIIIRSANRDSSEVSMGAVKVNKAGAFYHLQHLTVTHTNLINGVAGAIEAQNGGYLRIRDIVVNLKNVKGDPGSIFAFYAASNGHIQWWAYDDNYTTGVTVISNTSTNTRIGGCMYAEDGGTIDFASDIRVIGNFSVVHAFADAIRLGTISANLSSYSNPGQTPRIVLLTDEEDSTNRPTAVTGKRYQAGSLSIINSRGVNDPQSENYYETYYPGSTTEAPYGIINSGSQYTYANVTTKSES